MKAMSCEPAMEHMPGVVVRTLFRLVMLFEPLQAALQQAVAKDARSLQVLFFVVFLRTNTRVRMVLGRVSSPA